MAEIEKEEVTSTPPVPAAEANTETITTPSSVPNSETTTTTTTTTKVKSGKPIIFIACGCIVVLLVLCLAFFGIFGYVKTGGECKYEGPLAPDSACTDSEDTEDVDTTDDTSDTTEDTDTDDTSSDTMKTYSADTYSLDYPATWYLDTSDSSTLYLYSTDPSLLAEGNYNDVVSAKSLGSLGKTSMTQTECEDFGSTVVSELEDSTEVSFDSVTLGIVEVGTLNGNSVCKFEMDESANGTTLTQFQYIFLNTDEDSDSYIVTTTVENNTSNNEQVNSIVESFDLD